MQNKTYELNRLTGWFLGELDTARNNLLGSLDNIDTLDPDKLKAALLENIQDLTESVNLIYNELISIGKKS